MAATKYKHSAYWYAYHYGWTYSEAKTLAGQYLDRHSYRPRMKRRPDCEFHPEDWLKWRDTPKTLDSKYNPLIHFAFAMADVGIAMRNQVAKLANPVERDRMKRELVQKLRRLRRPFYYAHETERRRELAVARRKIARRRTTAPMPTPDDIRAAWDVRKSSREAMIRLGGMIHDLECYVDNCLKFDENGNVAGRNGGIRQWLKGNVPELSSKYKTLMRYKAMAIRVRQATNTFDPIPTSELLDEKPRNKVLASILDDADPVFSRVFGELERILSPDTVFLDKPKSPQSHPEQAGATP